MTTPDKAPVRIDADVAEWLHEMLFPASGEGGASISGVPGNPEFDKAVDLFTRARDQLGGNA